MAKITSLPSLGNSDPVSAFPLDIACIVLVILTPISYLPINRNVAGLLVNPPTDGISITAALLLALCAQAQVVTMYYLWACPPFKRYGEVVPHPPRRLDYINLVQIIVQWICAVGFLCFLLNMRPPRRSLIRLDTDLDSPHPVSPSEHDAPSPSSMTAFILLTVHAILSIGWALFAGIPTQDWLDLTFVLIMSAQQYIINPVIAILTVIALGLQINMTRKLQGASALTRWTVAPQALVFLALAISWPMRFKMPRNLSIRRDRWWWVAEWYPQVGWAGVNSVVIGFGLTVVAFYAGTERAGSGRDGASEALLGT
ncbi:hypothetical protein DE146DRAFT_525984 [Phaeosphaeria sp. MPI-PUGE-AT-0046c]|nr:hypothetical protein DE146DRAFT_525984 [Phaeosphaeria sp. MPI-PUGE-AT-0046c]